MNMGAYRRILVVDDEEQVVFVLRNSLKKLGPMYEIVTAANGREALDRMNESPVDLLITDLAMPGMDGVSLTEAVRTRDLAAKVVWITAYDQWREVAEQMGVCRYILKPLDVSEIRRITQEELADPNLPSMPPLPPSAPQPAATPDRTAPKILIMDDNDDLRRLYGKTLTKAGYAVYSAATIQQARELLAQQRFDVFLSDIRMDEGLGIDLVREKMGDLKQAGTQVVMISAEARYRDICEEMGIDFYVEKPVALAPLVTLVNRLTGVRTPQAIEG